MSDQLRNVNDEYCPKHETWFGSQGCPSCQVEREQERERRNAAYGCGDQAGGWADTCQECKGTGRAA